MYPHARDHHFRGRAVDFELEKQAQRVHLHSPVELCPLLDHLENWMRVLGYPGKDVFAVRLALEEAAVNAFRHGNRGDPGKSVQLRWLVTATEVVLEVEDEGPGFDPEAVPDPLAEENLDRPGGRGLLLMRAYMTWVSFNRQGNRVTLVRQRSDS